MGDWFITCKKKVRCCILSQLRNSRYNVTFSLYWADNDEHIKDELRYQSNKAEHRPTLP